jgi:superfamily I DNA/RNA helicase
MAEKSTTRQALKKVETLTHDEASRLNIPTAEYQSLIQKEYQDSLRVAYERSRLTRTDLTEAGIFSQLAAKLADGAPSPFDFVVIDEAQDVSIAQLRFLAALGKNLPDALFFAGDLGQRIFQQPFSWKAVGVDIRGRSTTLKINYRTSHQIRARADRLLGASVSDIDGNVEERKGTTSVFNGPLPVIEGFKDAEAEAIAVGRWLKARVAEDHVLPHEIGVFVRSAAEIDRARNAITRANLKAKILDDSVEIVPGHASAGTMHLAKGLEFRAVAVIACDDEVIPSPDRLEAAADDSDLEEVYNTGRHLLYVACTRARDQLLVTGVKPTSEFLDDLNTKPWAWDKSARRLRFPDALVAEPWGNHRDVHSD